MLFLINIFYCLTLILLQIQQSETRGPVCLQCDQVAQPSDCKNIKRCGDQELCIMRKYVTDDGHIWFDVGCSSSLRCTPITSILGKRNYDEGLLPIASSTLRSSSIHNSISSYVRSAVDTIVCEKCCFGDICNAGSLCGTVGFLHEMVCLNCVSSKVDECNTIALCDKDQKCFIEKVDKNITWKTGCRHKDMCQQQQSHQGTECLSSCCSSDLCNMKCANNNTEARCVDKSLTCSNKTFQSFVCSQTQLQDTCPRSCGLCHCDPNPCIHGTCTSSRQGYKCTCESGYTGSICNRVIDHCISNPCIHGLCNNSPQGYNCSCSSVYVGSTCAEISPCVARPCIHGICYPSHSGYYCSCYSGFTGSICDTENSHWKWTDCGDPATRAITVSHFDIFPRPIHIPGNMTADYDITIHRRIENNSHLKINVIWEMKLLSHWHVVPCNHLIGTCVYDDVCEFLSNIACSQAGISLRCKCPIHPVHLVMNNHSQRSHINVSSIHASSFFGSLLSGSDSPLVGMINVLSGRFEVKKIPPVLRADNHRLRIEVLDGAKMIGCLAVELVIRLPCYGFLCGG